MPLFKSKLLQQFVANLKRLVEWFWPILAPVRPVDSRRISKPAWNSVTGKSGTKRKVEICHLSNEKSTSLCLASYNHLKVNNRNTEKMCEICSELTIKTSEWRHWRRSGVFIVNFEHISHLFVLFVLITLDK